MVYATHFFMSRKVFRNINQLHNSDEGDAHFYTFIVNMQPLCHDDTLRSEILIDQVVMMQVGQLSKHLKCNLGNIYHLEGLFEVAQMIQVIMALIYELVDDIYVIM